MNKSQTAKLLGLAAAFDRRTVGEADVEAWHAVLDNTAYDDAAEVVKAHYRTRRDWIMPVDVLAGVRKIRADRLDRAGPLTPPPDLTPVETVEWLRRTRRAIADGTYTPPALEAKRRDMRFIDRIADGMAMDEPDDESDVA